MIRSAFAVILFLLPLSLYSQHSQSIERTIAGQVSGGNLLQHVRDLVALGNRQGGTPSGDAAARYARKVFRGYGLPTIVDTNGARLVSVSHSWTLSVREPGRLRGLIKNEWLSGYSPSVAPRVARLVHLSADGAITREAFDSAAVVTGKSVSQDLYSDLVQAGAVCILSYAPDDPASYPRWALIGELPASETNPIPVFNISYKNGGTLKRELEKGTKITLRFSARTSIREGRPKTVIATLTGRSREYFVVCAHGDSDSGGPGADDNASGVAGVLELARVLHSMVSLGQLPLPEKSIKFIVWGSEYHSSTDFVRTQADNLQSILGVFNYDQIGTGATRDCLYFEGNDIGVNDKLLRTLNAVGEEYAGKRTFWEEATTNPAQGGTDSYVFLPDYLSRLGLPQAEIPSVTIYTAAWNSVKTMAQTEGWQSKGWKGHPDSVSVDYSRYYHSSLDIPALTTEKEPFNMEWAVKAVGIALHRVAWEKPVP